MTSLVAAQPGIYIADKLASYENTYVVAHYCEIKGDLNVPALVDAINQGMAETDTLQMEFCEQDGCAVQVFKGDAALPQPEIIVHADVHALITEDLASNMRVGSVDQLVRHAIIQVGPESWVWYQRYHHLQVDAYSFTALTRRIASLYSARIRGEPLDFHPFTKIDRVVEEYTAYEESPKYQKDLDFWKKCELPPAHSLKPVAGAVPSKNVFRSGLKRMNEQHFAKLCELGSPSDMALGLVALWLMRICNCDAMSLGFIFMRRLGSVALNAAGAFINVLPLAVSGASVQEVVATITKQLKVLRRHQKVNSETIVRETGRSWESDPLFGPVINLKAFDFELDFEGLEVTTHHLASGPIRDIEIVIFLEGTQLVVEYLANGDRYDKPTLDRHFERLDLLLSEIAGNVDEQIVLPQELKLLNRVNSTEHVGLENTTLWSLIHAQCGKSPHDIALQDINGGLTYARMSEAVVELARKMVTFGVQKGDIVAVKLPRSLALSLTLQAILSLGAAYLPLDPGYPAERLQMMIDDAQPKLVLSPETVLPEAGNQNVEISGPSPDDIAYVIYTSGSTGRPKGVEVSHRAIVNRICWMQDKYKLTKSDVVMQKTPSSFDVSVWEFFWPLVSGARSFLAPPDAHRDPELLSQLITEFEVTTVHFVPSMLSTFLSFAQGIQLRRVFCSGEALPVALAQSWREATGVPLHNLYGPTEAAIDVTYYDSAHEPGDAGSVPIGFPVWNTKMYVLDSRMRLLPPGVAGNLYIGGVQLACGYLHRPELTAERFIYRDGERLYHTGDLARWLPNGALEFLGRSDEQVKIRGQRIELGEINACMEAVPGVSQAVTHPQEIVGGGGTADSRQLVGYVVAAPGFDTSLISEALAKRLPAYMVPVKFVVLQQMPLSATGKLDRKKLPKVAVDETPSLGRPPAPGVEQTIAQTYESLLGVPYVSAEDDFFSLGGHSLLAVKLAAELRKELGRPVTIGQVMQFPRVENLAAQVSSGDTGEAAGFDTVLKLRPTESGPTVFCVHPASGFAWQFSVLRRYLAPHWSLVGLQSTHADDAMGGAENLSDVVDAHYETITKYSESGPYYLLGYSLGGTLAHSLAAKLVREGKKVQFLGLLDTWPPETQNWDAKRGENMLDQAVVDEMNREREQFLAVNVDDGFSTRMFDAIEANYSTAVRLLVTARSQFYDGETVLFVADRTLPENTDLQQVWKPFTKSLTTVGVDCSHIDIIHPSTFETLGPKINALLENSYAQQ